MMADCEDELCKQRVVEEIAVMANAQTELAARSGAGAAPQRSTAPVRV